MSEPRNFASLSSTLLARKGQARPAMRPQAFQLSNGAEATQAMLEDLGWNDMGHELPSSSVTSIAPDSLSGMGELPPAGPPPLNDQIDRLAAHFEATEPVTIVPTPQSQIEPRAQAAPRAAAGSRGKAAFTLRLDSERHLHLRMMCAVRHKSAQQIVTLALDEFLARQPSIADLGNGN